MRRLFAALAFTVLLAGCTSTADDDTGRGGVTPAAAPVAAGSIAETQQSGGALVPGYLLSVPKLGLSNVQLVALGLVPDKTHPDKQVIEVPPLSKPRELGVYAKGPMPGAVGPSVILGHINAGGQDGVFAHLADLKVGDEITSTGPGLQTRFRVYRTQVIDKAEFPKHDVYSDTPGPELRLITCGGALDSTAHNYLSNVIVYARKV